MGEAALKREPVAPIEELRSNLIAAVRAALAAKYTSFSSKDNLPTGNGYQSVRLGPNVREGFRTLRRSVLAGLPIDGARVLDLGCNLGELSRLARECGAAMVDGFEYDDFFVEIGRAINAVNGVTRVSFFQRDITKPEVFQEQYDIVLCFSVFTYARMVLPQIAKSCRRILLLETHKIEKGWESEYVDKVREHFPYYAIVHRTDWGTGMEGARLIIAYARTMDEIDEFVTQRYRELETDGEQVRHLDVAQSDPEFLRRFRTWLKQHDGAELNELREPVRAALAALGDYTDTADYQFAASGLVYWLTYLAGYFDYRDRGLVTPNNPYIAYLKTACPRLGFDPYMSQLVNDPKAIADRVRLRFKDMDTAAERSPVPIIVYNPMPNTGAMTSSLVDVTTGANLMFSHEDGYHRHFAALVNRQPHLPYRVVWQPQHSGCEPFLKRDPLLERQLFDVVRKGLD